MCVPDFPSIIVHKTGKLLAFCKVVEKKLEGYLESKMERPDISYEILKMFVTVDELLEYAELLNFSNSRGWDFRPWFLEKASGIKRGLRGLYKYWEEDPAMLKLPESIPLTPEEFIIDEIAFYMEHIKVNAQAIFDMICYDGIIIEPKSSRTSFSRVCTFCEEEN